MLLKHWFLHPTTSASLRIKSGQIATLSFLFRYNLRWALRTDLCWYLKRRSVKKSCREDTGCRKAAALSAPSCPGVSSLWKRVLRPTRNGRQHSHHYKKCGGAASWVALPGTSWILHSDVSELTAGFTEVTFGQWFCINIPKASQMMVCWAIAQGSWGIQCWLLCSGCSAELLMIQVALIIPGITNRTLTGIKGNF